MDDLVIQIKPLDHYQGLPLPRYATSRSSGLDLFAAIDQPVSIGPGHRMLIPTGLQIALPDWVEGQIRPRSGLALDHGVTVLNAPGTIDSDYRGEVKVLLVNLGEKRFRIDRGDRIAQLIIQRVIRGEIRFRSDLTETERGQGGFGHTGR